MGCHRGLLRKPRGFPRVVDLRVLTRNPIERFFDTIKQCRRIASRQDLAANYLA
ncbi:MAG TPA: hypothetical protein VNR65_17820 [Geobacterales bacterium]|nr:hypothetical protein [Geobacterales bacterium]